MPEMTYIVYSPGYNPRIGGVIALHKLAHNIALCGGRSMLWSESKNPNWLGEVRGPNTSLNGIENPLVIYPEVTAGNYLDSPRVMRWILSKPGLCGKDQRKTYGENDLIYSYNSHYTAGMRIDGLLAAYEWGLDFWRDSQGERRGEAFAIRKGSTKQLNLHGHNAIGIDGYKSNDDLLPVFTRVNRFISYDHMTALSIQAALCGAESVVAPADDLTAEEWREMFPYFRYGIAYGTSDIELEYARTTVPLMREWLRELEVVSIGQTIEFMRKAESCK